MIKKKYKVVSNFEWANQFIKIGKVLKYDKYFNAYILVGKTHTFVFSSRDITNLLEEDIIKEIEEHGDFKI